MYAGQFRKLFGVRREDAGIKQISIAVELESRDRGTYEFLQSDVLDEFVHQVARAAVLHTVTTQIQLRQRPVQLSEGKC